MIVPVFAIPSRDHACVYILVAPTMTFARGIASELDRERHPIGLTKFPLARECAQVRTVDDLDLIESLAGV